MINKYLRSFIYLIMITTIDYICFMNNIKDFFNFNRRQERGVFVLCLILISVIIINHYSITLFNDTKDYETGNIDYLKQLKLAGVEKFSKSNIADKNEHSSHEDNLILPKAFNPNTVSVACLLEMGLSEKIANNIKNYRNFGGKFYKKEDLKKIYGLSEKVYATLENYISIPQKTMAKKHHQYTSKAGIKDSLIKKEYKKEIITKSLSLGLNSADSTQLVQIKGIGPFYASAIIKHRDKLGGYIDVNQLLELYKMDTVKYERMKKHLFVDTISLIRININTADFKTILNHPYIDYETTKFIVNKRRELGQYAALYQLKDPIAMPDDKYQKLLPYLAID